ncbi:hypothetical protein Tco_0510720 [Tanacetum coccineum]
MESKIVNATQASNSMCSRRFPRKWLDKKLGDVGDGVSNWTLVGYLARVLGESDVMMHFLGVGGGGETRWGWIVGGFNLLEALEIEDLVDAMDIDSG